MKFKKVLAVALTTLSAVFAIGITAAASTNDTFYRFRLTAYAGQPGVTTVQELKEFDWEPSVLVYEGIPEGDRVHYRIRNADESYASDVVWVGYWDMYEEVWEYMEYLPGMGVVGKYYRLASSYNAGQSEKYVTTDGVWTP